VGVRAWHWVWLALSAVATWLLFENADPDSQGLVILQLTGGWTGHLGQALANWSAASDITRLIEYDFLFIATYATLIPILIFFALRFENPTGYPAPSTAIALGFCGGWLPVVDILENLLTL